MLIITLSSVPPRFSRIGETLASLLAQSAAVDGIFLYIPESYLRFPDWDGRLPEVPQGVEIRRCATDYGPATKVLAAAREFKGQDTDILFCDDDRRFHSGWAQRFVDESRKHPDCCIAEVGFEAVLHAGGNPERALQPRAVRRWRITDLDFQLRYLIQDIRAGANRASLPEPLRRIYRRSGYIDIFEGHGGVLVRPEFFDDIACDIPPQLWPVDDIWLSGLLAEKGVPIWLRANAREAAGTEAEQHAPLYKAVIEGATQERSNKSAIAYMRDRFGVWI